MAVVETNFNVNVTEGVAVFTTGAIKGVEYIETEAATVTGVGEVAPNGEGVGILSDTATIFILQEVVETFTIADSAVVSVPLSVNAEPGVLSDSFETTTIATETSAGTLSDTLLPVTEAATVTDRAVLSDRHVITREVLVTETATLADTNETFITAELSSTGILTDTPILQTVQLQEETSTFVASDSFQLGSFADEVSAFIVTDSIINLGSAVQAELLISSAVLRDEIVIQNTAIEELTSVGLLSDAIVPSPSSYINHEVSTGILRDAAWAPDFDQIAWVMNTETTALTNYENFGYDSIAFADGALFAVSPMGLYKFDADRDETRTINAYWSTGLTDFGLQEIKRMSDIYTGYVGGPLECQVETYENDSSFSYNYELVERDSSAPRNSRIKVGKGLKSRYWRFTFSNVGGADFQVFDLTGEAAISRRRL